VLALRLVTFGSPTRVAARVKQVVGLLTSLLVAVTLASCSGDGGTGLKADFSSRFEQPNTGPTSCPVIAIHFQDRTTGGPTAWEWTFRTFDDGSTSSEQNPTWETGALEAKVTLTARRGDAEDSVTRRIVTHEC
jgi:hypothetical protein